MGELMLTDFLEKLILQSVGPLLSAIFGTLIIGVFVARITQNAQDRRADNHLNEERIRSQNRLRVQLIGEMTKAAGSLYMATQNFWRKKDVEKVGNDELANHREELDQQYRASRVMGEVIELKLEAYFSFKEPRTRSLPEAHWHATMDLLTVRYFYLIGLTTEKLLKDNAGDEHTGLTVEDLGKQNKVLETYHDKLRTSAQAVLQEAIRPQAG